MGCITHDERIRPVSKTTCQGDFGTRPLTRLFRYPRMQRPALIRPCIRRVVDIDGVPAAAWRITDPPLVPAEKEWDRCCRPGRGPFRSGYSGHLTARVWQRLHHCLRAIPWLDQQGRII